jgi:hypothetical protein
MTDALKDRFISLAVRLSPENLHCDGMATRGHVALEKAQIAREWRECEDKAKRKVTEDEVDQWMLEEMTNPR